jgi:hypothetical protein
MSLVRAVMQAAKPLVERHKAFAEVYRVVAMV